MEHFAQREDNGYIYPADLLEHLLRFDEPLEAMREQWNESREYTETVSVASKNKDKTSVLVLLPQAKEFVTEDGLLGTLLQQFF